MSVLYRKYRSKSLDELVGQDHIVRALKNSIAGGKIAHAYLLTGPKGTGKTSVARIIAHAVNDIVYDEQATNLDIIEIDAASNRRIDEIRDLRDKVHIAPTTLKYKVYIIDEVHMLTKEAFNALLKTLEEPPSHAIFILATTELQKVPDTIISRTQRFSFKPISTVDIVKHLSWIADQEKIEYDDAGLESIALHADGGFRDAISLLDQVRHTSDIVSSEAVMEALGTPPESMIISLWSGIKNTEPDNFVVLKRLYDSGYHAPQITKQLLKHAINDATIELAHELLSIGSLGDAKVELQLFVLSHSNTSTVSTHQNKVIAREEKESTVQPTQNTLQKSTIQNPEQKEREATPSKPITDEAPLVATTTVEASDDSTWNKILEHIKEGGHSVYGPLRLAEAVVSDQVLNLKLAFPFHIKRINDQKNLEAIHQAVMHVTGKQLNIVVEKIDRTANNEPKQDHIKTQKIETSKIDVPDVDTLGKKDPDIELMSDPLSIVKNVFGGAEVL